MDRRLSTSVVIDGVDDETFGSNEYGHLEDTSEAVLSETSQPANVLSSELRFGGEVRIELDLMGQLRTNGDVLVSGTAKLFEGTSENTNDLDGTKNFSVLVPAGKLVNTKQVVKNTDEGGDYATIRINFANFPA